MKRLSSWLLFIGLFSIVGAGCESRSVPNLGGGSGGAGSGGLETREITEYHPPNDEDSTLSDDRLEAKMNTFVSELVDRRPLGEWSINQSEAVIRLDVPMLLPDSDQALMTLHASYAQAHQAMKQAGLYHGQPLLPSVNLLDGKAKQFDDGLYAAIDQAYYRGINDRMRSHVDMIERMLAKVGADSPAAPFLGASLKIAGRDVRVTDTNALERHVAQFQSNPVASKPISFYTWNKTLEDCWRFMRFLQQPLSEKSDVAVAIATALATDSTLEADYRQAAEFYGRLTNPLSCLTLADLATLAHDGPVTEQRIKDLGKQKGVTNSGVAVFPPSSSKEGVLFEKLFGNGLPANADLMRELVKRIRSGEVNLATSETSGWYDYQVYALETMLLAEKGDEWNKLYLSKSYKKRMLEAFKALITKRRETHARQLKMPMAEAMAPPIREKPERIVPRLRVEPAPTYFLRTARAYAFVLNLLESTFGDETIRELHGLTATGERADDLHTELRSMRDRFYGLYLISCEDIGMAPRLMSGETDSEDRCYELASDWLSGIADDPDLAADTRVSIPIMMDLSRNVTRLWVTLGVRMSRLETHFATPPRIRPVNSEGEWELVDRHTMGSEVFLIAVDEFAEVEIPGAVSLSREELRAICDRAKTKEAIIEAIQSAR